MRGFLLRSVVLPAWFSAILCACFGLVRRSRSEFQKRVRSRRALAAVLAGSGRRHGTLRTLKHYTCSFIRVSTWSLSHICWLVWNTVRLCRYTPHSQTSSINWPRDTRPCVHENIASTDICFLVSSVTRAVFLPPVSRPRLSQNVPPTPPPQRTAHQPYTA